MVEKTREGAIKYREDLPPLCLSTISAAIICICLVIASVGYISQMLMSQIAAAMTILFGVDQLVIKRLDSYNVLILALLKLFK